MTASKRHRRWRAAPGARPVRLPVEALRVRPLGEVQSSGRSGDRQWSDRGGFVLLGGDEWSARPPGENRRIVLDGIDFAVVAEGAGVFRVVSRRVTSSLLAGRPSVQRVHRDELRDVA